jgi:hypothetical protein
MSSVFEYDHQIAEMQALYSRIAGPGSLGLVFAATSLIAD